MLSRAAVGSLCRNMLGKDNVVQYSILCHTFGKGCFYGIAYLSTDEGKLFAGFNRKDDDFVVYEGRSEGEQTYETR